MRSPDADSMPSMLIRGLTSIMSPQGRNARLTVLTFHRVLSQPDPLEPDTPDSVDFERQVRWLQQQFNLLPLSEGCDRLFDGTLPARAAAISIDDGYRDNFDIALPLLKRLGVPATFFIATRFLNGSAMFNDRLNEALRRTRLERLDAGRLGLPVLPIADMRQKLVALRALVRAVKYRALAEREALVAHVEGLCEVEPLSDMMMDARQLRAMLDAGMELGGHTRNHPILRVLPDSEAYDEIAGSHDDLLRITGRAPRLFAFPNGRLGDDFDARHAAMARRAGFDYAFTTESGAAHRNTDPMQIPRFATWSSDRLRFQLRLVRNLHQSAPPLWSDKAA